MKEAQLVLKPPVSKSMSTHLSAERIEALAVPMLLPAAALPAVIWEQLASDVDLLYRWNQRMNLTAVRDAEELAAVHLGECLRSAQLLPAGIASLLDFGSGAGLPGIPIQLARPEIAVTLAESQGKKAGFLREAVRVLGLKQATVYTGRVEAMPAAQRFEAVALRAVDAMEVALPAAAARVDRGGWCVVLTTEAQAEPVRALLPEMAWRTEAGLPGSKQRVVLVGQKQA